MRIERPQEAGEGHRAVVGDDPRPQEGNELKQLFGQDAVPALRLGPDVLVIGEEMRLIAGIAHEPHRRRHGGEDGDEFLRQSVGDRELLRKVAEADAVRGHEQQPPARQRRMVAHVWNRRPPKVEEAIEPRQELGFIEMPAREVPGEPRLRKVPLRLRDEGGDRALDVRGFDVDRGDAECRLEGRRQDDHEPGREGFEHGAAERLRPRAIVKVDVEVEALQKGRHPLDIEGQEVQFAGSVP